MYEKIKTLIVEDDESNIKLLKILLEKYCSNIKTIGIAKNSNKFIDLLLKKEPELILLDIHLGEKKNTLEILSEMKNLNFEIIIITSDESFAIKAINKYKVSGYLIKPINILELKNIISNVELKIQEKLKDTIEEGLSEQLVAISNTNSIELLIIKDIIYLEADGKYTVIYLDNGTSKIVSKNIGEYEKLLPQQIFYRIHHKYIVNLHKVKSINKSFGDYCHLVNGKSLSIAKRRKEALRKFLHL